MSRVGKKPIPIPNSVRVQIEEQNLSVKGAKGELTYKVPIEIRLEHTDSTLWVKPKTSQEQKRVKSLHGLVRTLVSNMIKGVSEGFQKELKIVGIGYRANITGNILNLFLGYSHPIKYSIPNKIAIEITKDNRILIQGIDKQQVGQVAAEIRDFKRPEPYKGKGIMYIDEKIRLKVGKAGA